MDLWHVFNVFLFWGLPYSFDLAKVSSTVVMWLPSRRCWSNLTNWWVRLEWTSTRWICIEVVMWDSPEYQGPKAAIFLLERFPKVCCLSAGNESNESYESESISCRKQGHATCYGLTCYNVSFVGEWLKEWAKQVGSNVVNCTSTQKLQWYLTCIYQRWEILLEWSSDHPSTDSTFLMLKFGFGNHSTCRDYHHYHYPNYCNLAEGSNRLVAWRCPMSLFFWGKLMEVI